MTKLITKTLHFERFKNLMNWSVAGIIARAISYNQKYELVSIGSFLDRNKNIIVIDDNTIYTQITLKINNGGVVERGKKRGSDIGTKKQTIVRQGQFLFSKIDARNGAFGIIPEGLDGSIVTNDFPVFEIDETRINPTFLLLVTTTESFLKFAQSCSSGTTNRQRIDVQKFLQQKVPLPSLEEQNNIVLEFNIKTQKANDLDAHSIKISRENQEYLYKHLNVRITKNNWSKGLNFIHFKDISRWDLSFFASFSKTFSKYDIITVGDCLESYMIDESGKTLRIETQKMPNQTFHYIGMECVEKDSGILLNMPEVKGSEIKSQTIKVPKGYFIYGKLRPYLNKYWYHDGQETDIVCSSEFFVFKIKNNLNKLYFKYILSSDFVQSQISKTVSGARMPRINEHIFKHIQIPMPPRSVQDVIAEHLCRQWNKIEQIKMSAQIMRVEALKRFEKKIFE